MDARGVKEKGAQVGWESAAGFCMQVEIERVHSGERRRAPPVIPKGYALYVLYNFQQIVNELMT